MVENEARHDENTSEAKDDEMEEDEAKSGKPKIKGFSMMEFFTPEQVRDHIKSLRQWVGQVNIFPYLSFYKIYLRL
jgi:hypothetical protein